MKKRIAHIKQYIKKGEFSLAFASVPFKRLSQQIKLEFDLLQSRFTSLEKDFHKGILTYEEFSVNRTRITESLLSQIAYLEQSDVTGGGIKKMLI